MLPEVLTFEIELQGWHMVAATLRALWFGKTFRCYIAVVAALGVPSVVMGSTDNFWVAWGLVTASLLAFPFAYTAGKTRHLWRTRNGVARTQYKLTPEALVAERDGMESKYRWEVFSTIRETRDFIYLFAENGPKLVVHKNLISGANVADVRQFIHEHTENRTQPRSR
jgi:hypothetical protein